MIILQLKSFSSILRSLKKTYLSSVVFCLIGVQLSAASSNNDNKFKRSSFKIVGYLRTANVVDGTALNIKFSQLNYLNVAFINPDEVGNFKKIKFLDAVVKKAHLKKVRVFMSIGGGLAPDYYTSLLADSIRDKFIAKIVKYVTFSKFDGVDVDLEGERIDNNYESFVIALSKELKKRSKLLTAAVATIYHERYTPASLEVFDLINIMSYDKTGPWAPAKPGQHSPYDMAVSDLDFWANTFKIPKEKLTLGLPFYGYGFGPNAPEDISFANLIKSYPGSKDDDQVNVPGGGIIYYNGMSTIKNKAKLALAQAGGVMIWELFQDASGNNSLLSAIEKTIKRERRKRK